MDPFTFLLSVLPPRWAGIVFLLIALCAYIDAAIPQPGPGSRWVPVRRVVSWVGGNWGAAKNRVVPGSVDATVTPADVLTAIVQTHNVAQDARVQLAGKVADVQRRVTSLMTQTGKPS